jgi:hypothetical protein
MFSFFKKDSSPKEELLDKTLPEYDIPVDLNSGIGEEENRLPEYEIPIDETDVPEQKNTFPEYKLPSKIEKNTNPEDIEYIDGGNTEDAVEIITQTINSAQDSKKPKAAIECHVDADVLEDVRRYLKKESRVSSIIESPASGGGTTFRLRFKEDEYDEFEQSQAI